MYIAELKVENFRLFGEADQPALLKLQLALTAVVEKNDSGKTAIVDALRIVLRARDKEKVNGQWLLFPSVHNIEKLAQYGL